MTTVPNASPTTLRNVFVVGLDEFNRESLERLGRANSCRFLPLLHPNEIVVAPAFDLPALIARAGEIVRQSNAKPDAIVGYWDFPTTLLLPLLREPWSLPGPTLLSLLRSEHKYFSRLCQRDVVPEHTPRFSVFDPFADDPLAQIDLPLPFWIKPVKSHSSHLGFAAHRLDDVERAVDEIRAHISRFAEPFDYILEQADLPEDVARVRGHYCIAEQMIATQWQCTVEGWVHRGVPHVYGVVDSIREGEQNSSFSRYQYPSRLPERITNRMSEIACQVATSTDLDETGFNAEFFYDEIEGHIWLLEVNARASKSHSPLFELVDGRSNLEVMVATGLGEEPEMPHRTGKSRIAAKFMVRAYEDGVVTRAPATAELERVARDVPDVHVQLHVGQGMRLSDLANQDSYTFELASVFVGARDDAELVDKYHRTLALLPFEIRFDSQAQPALRNPAS